MTDNEPQNKLRSEMKQVERLVSKVSDEALIYMIRTVDNELNRRSRKYELSHKNKNKYRIENEKIYT